jgi:hypothetical protein
MFNTVLPAPHVSSRRFMSGLFVALLLLSGAAALASCGAATTEVQGAIASVNAAASNFVVTAQQNSASVTSFTVTVSPQTEFRGALHAFSDLRVGMRVKASGTAQSGASAFAASEIEDEHEAGHQDEQGPGDQDASQFKGTVGSVNSAQSTFTLGLVDDTTKTVAVSSQTEFEGGLHSLADLTQGQHVSVKEVLQADGSIAASSVEAENEDENEPEDANEVEVTGTIAALNSGASSFVITLAGGAMRTVVTNAHTEFDGGIHGFSDLTVGMRVEVRSAAQANGALLATRVHRDDDGVDDHGGADGHGGSGDGSGGSGSSSGGSDDHSGGTSGDDGSGHH